MRTRGSAAALAGAALAILVALAPGAGAQGERIERWTEWPELDRPQRKAVQREVDKLCKARTEEMEATALAALRDMGTAAAPHLLKALGKERDEDARGRLTALLTELTDAQHTRLLAAELASRSLELRVFCLRRVAAFPDPGTRPAVEKLWKGVVVAEAKGRADRRELEAAALATAAAGSTAGLEHVLALARTRWSEEGVAVRAACEGVRGDEATRLLVPRLAGERAERVAALRLLAGCGTPLAVPEVRPLLDESDQGLRLATVNALRGIVDGNPPLENPSVFHTIEEVEAWKRRL